MGRSRRPEGIAADLASKPCCMGNHYTLADVAVGCTLGWLALPLP